MFKLQKNNRIVTLFFLVNILVMSSAEARYDRKTLSGSICSSAGIFSGPLASDQFPGDMHVSTSGSISGFTHLSVVCPIVRDISRGRKINIRVNLLHRSLNANSIPDTQNYKREKTTCSMHGIDKTGKTGWTTFFTVNGVGHLSAKKTVYPPSHINSMILVCRLGKGNILYSYSYIESRR